MQPSADVQRVWLGERPLRIEIVLNDISVNLLLAIDGHRDDGFCSPAGNPPAQIKNVDSWVTMRI